MPIRSRDTNMIMYNHYLWCKEQGRDTSWFRPHPLSFKRQGIQALRDKNIKRKEVAHGGNGIHNR